MRKDNNAAVTYFIVEIGCPQFQSQVPSELSLDQLTELLQSRGSGDGAWDVDDQSLGLLSLERERRS